MLRPESALYYVDALQDVASDFITLLECNLDENSELPSNDFNILYCLFNGTSNYLKKNLAQKTT